MKPKYIKVLDELINIVTEGERELASCQWYDLTNGLPCPISAVLLERGAREFYERYHKSFSSLDDCLGKIARDETGVPPRLHVAQQFFNERCPLNPDIEVTIGEVFTESWDRIDKNAIEYLRGLWALTGRGEHPRL